MVTSSQQLKKNIQSEGYKQSNNDICFAVRARFTVAEVNAGATLLPALRRHKYQMAEASVIAVGGAAAAVTTVDILATQAAASVKLLAAAQANLTQSAVVRDGGTGGAILADGASYAVNDVNTPITIGKTGSTITGATSFDVVFQYMIINA